MSKQHRQAAYARQQKWHEDRVDNPSRAEWVLRRAVDKAGLDVVEYEYRLVDDESGRWYWFDVACNIGGQIVLLDLVGGHAKGGRSKRQAEIEQEKARLCEREAIPLLQIHRSRGTMEITAQLHIFAMQVKGGHE